MVLDPDLFRQQYSRFLRLIPANDQGHAFTNFREGLAGVWEGYKPRLREQARKLLAPETWTEEQIGTGGILDRVIAAIEIQDSRINLTNNLVFWQNRFGHANREHRFLLEARNDRRARQALEQALFDLYVTDADEGVTFDLIASLTGAKYPLLAYLFFLKGPDRFMPIQPTGFDAAFRLLGVDLVTLRNCYWRNYAQYNHALFAVRDQLTAATGLPGLRLVDAHSFCWMLVKLREPDPDNPGVPIRAGVDPGRILGARERSITDIKYSIINVAKSSNGQVVVRNVQMKSKDLRFTPEELDKFIRELLDLQGDKCSLTGIPFQFNEEGANRNFRPSPDRINSDGHYERGNLQLVCRFVNMWKADMPDDEFRDLLALVRGEPQA